MSSSLRKPIIYSALFHLMAVISFAVAPGIYFPFIDKSMQIDVMWVELPKGTGEDIGTVLKESEGLPKSTIEEQKQTLQPEKPPEQKPLPPEIKASPPAKVEKAKPEPRPTVDTSKMKLTDKNAKLDLKAAPKKVDRKIQNALAMIDKQLKGRQVVPEAAQIGQTGEGYKYGTGDKPVRLSRSDPEFLKYQAMVRSKIMRSWIAPANYLSDDGRKFSAQLVVFINMDGEVLSSRWQKASGNATFDESAKRAVRNASPFPKPLDRLAWEAINEGFLVEFRP